VRSSLAYLYPAVPALLAFAAWLPVVIRQSSVAQPYTWIRPPAVLDLALTVAPDAKAGVVGALMLLGIALFERTGARAAGGAADVRANSDLKLQSALIALMLFIAFTIAAWIVSTIAFPIFVIRYFTPNLLLYFAATTAFVGLAFRLLGETARWFAAGIAMALSAVAVALATPSGTLPCFDAESQAFIEGKPGLIDPKLPVVTVSPRSWFPRVYYAPSPATYLFPLDWEVVLKFPDRERNNAVDFNIMQRFQAWADIPTIVTTDALLRAHNEFYVVNEDTRGWLDNLKRNHATQETLLARSDVCSLVRIRVDPAM
jgi:hypothetical protein